VHHYTLGVGLEVHPVLSPSSRHVSSLSHLDLDKCSLYVLNSIPGRIIPIRKYFQAAIAFYKGIAIDVGFLISLILPASCSRLHQHQSLRLTKPERSMEKFSDRFMTRSTMASEQEDMRKFAWLRIAERISAYSLPLRDPQTNTKQPDMKISKMPRGTAPLAVMLERVKRTKEWNARLV
jgi:hypothetical protein